ncbi:hypothetical protein FA15DRAFT_328061 [Coprinopsis marcescibilis]|uniref:Uncharacterized protein n=1 Tax=Coprinopsis marcescibilis TaxID=230819 RepID=A0A5C3KZB0_COPMA|nr:hypothetical protein FA15DRAFT_328061 [Coprinopsis marcescibilis]
MHYDLTSGRFPLVVTFVGRSLLPILIFWNCFAVLGNRFRIVAFHQQVLSHAYIHPSSIRSPHFLHIAIATTYIQYHSHPISRFPLCVPSSHHLHIAHT